MSAPFRFGPFLLDARIAVGGTAEVYLARPEAAGSELPSPLVVKRLHDRDKSGWWILLFYLTPSVLGSIANTSEQPLVGFVFGVGSFVISIWALVELGFLRGTVGPNRYGPDPLQPLATASVAPASPGP